MRKVLFYTLLITPLFGKVEVILPENSRVLERYPIYFLPEDSSKLDVKEDFLPTLTYQFGVRYHSPINMVMSESMFDNSTREVEFFSESSLSPYFQIEFEDMEIFQNKGFFFGNLIEANYLSLSEQTPFYPDSGDFPYETSYDVGSKIDSISIFWRGDLSYKVSFLSIEGFFGTGINSMSGNAKLVRYAPHYITDINGTTSENLTITENGEILQEAQEFVLGGDISHLIKFGFSLNLNFDYLHIGFGYEQSSTSESNRYWILSSYFMEFGFQYSY